MVTPAAEGDRPLGWDVAGTPDLVLGAEEVGEQAFYRIVGARQLPDRRLVVLDRGSLELRFFDSSGGLTKTIGGRGEGPGEFERPTLIPAPSSDSLMIWDARLGRITVLHTGQQTGVRTVTPRSWYGAVAPEGMAEGAALLAHLASPVGGIEAGVQEDTLLYSWVHLPEGDPVPITRVARAILYSEVGPNGVPFLVQIPFAPRSSAVTRGPEAWISSGRSPQIQVFDLEGRLHRVARIDRAPIAVSDEMIDRYISGEVGDRSEMEDQLRALIERMPRVDHVPSFRSLLVDDLGFVWASWYSWDPAKPTLWTVFEGGGRALGTVETPPGLAVTQVGDDFVVGVARSELDVEEVHRYPLTRRDRQ